MSSTGHNARWTCASIVSNGFFFVIGWWTSRLSGATPGQPFSTGYQARGWDFNRQTVHAHRRPLGQVLFLAQPRRNRHPLRQDEGQDACRGMGQRPRWSGLGALVRQYGWQGFRPTRQTRKRPLAAHGAGVSGAQRRLCRLVRNHSPAGNRGCPKSKGTAPFFAGQNGSI